MSLESGMFNHILYIASLVVYIKTYRSANEVVMIIHRICTFAYVRHYIYMLINANLEDKEKCRRTVYTVIKDRQMDDIERIPGARSPFLLRALLPLYHKGPNNVIPIRDTQIH